MSDSRTHTPTPDYSGWSKDELIHELNRMSALIDGRFADARLLSAAPSGNGAFVLDIQTGLSGVMAENMCAILRGEGAPNFVEVEATHPELGPLTFSVARRLGRSSAVQLAECRASHDGLVEALREAQIMLARLARPEASDNTMHAWAACVEAELKCRRALEAAGIKTTEGTDGR